MILILISLVMGYLFSIIGGITGSEFFKYLFGAVGVLSPGLFVLEKMYKEIKK